MRDIHPAKSLVEPLNIEVLAVLQLPLPQAVETYVSFPILYIGTLKTVAKSTEWQLCQTQVQLGIHQSLTRTFHFVPVSDGETEA